MNRHRHTRQWPGDCPRSGRWHACARPVGHTGICMCKCGDRAPKLKVPAPGAGTSGGVQGTLL